MKYVKRYSLHSIYNIYFREVPPMSSIVKPPFSLSVECPLLWWPAPRLPRRGPARREEHPRPQSALDKKLAMHYCKWWFPHCSGPGLTSNLRFLYFLHFQLRYAHTSLHYNALSIFCTRQFRYCIHIEPKKQLGTCQCLRKIETLAGGSHLRNYSLPTGNVKK